MSEKKPAEKVTFNLDKVTNFSDWYNEIIRLAELVDMRYGIKGFIVYRDWSTISIKEMFKIFEKLLEQNGHTPTIFPILIPESNFQIEKEHVAGFTPEVMWVTEGGGNRLEERLAMRPTSETAMYPLYALWIRSYRDLPLKHYQSGPVWRYETKATRPFVRGREFWWIEAHDVFATYEESVKQVLKDLEISRSVIADQLGVPLMQMQRPQWDKFAGADETFVSDAIMPNGRFLQLPSTHLLGQRFAKAFGIKYLDDTNNEHICYQTCYGPGITRIYGAVIATHGDNSGLVLTYQIAPIQVVIVPIFIKNKNAEKVTQKCQELVKIFKERNIRVKLDDSEGRPGDKYYFWEMKGVPFRLEIGSREAESDKLTICIRDTHEKINVSCNPTSNIVTVLEEQGQLMLQRMKAKAWNTVKDLIVDGSKENITMESLTKLLTDGKVAKIPFCTMDKEGQKCADILKEKTGGGDIRGRLLENHDELFMKPDNIPSGTKCVCCDKPATVYVYVGKQY